MAEGYGIVHRTFLSLKKSNVHDWSIQQTIASLDTILSYIDFSYHIQQIFQKNIKNWYFTVEYF